MDGVLPFLILILVIGASVGIAIGMSAIMSRWERSVPKPGMSDFMDISKSLAPDLIPSKVFVLDSASTTLTRSWFIRDATTETVIANVEYETNGDIVLKMTSGERYFLENTEPPHRVCTLQYRWMEVSERLFSSGGAVPFATRMPNTNIRSRTCK